MVSLSLLRYIKSLEKKKFRNQHGFFIAEGDKIVRELLDADLAIDKILALEQWIEANIGDQDSRAEVISISAAELARVSTLKTPNQALAVVRIPQYLPDKDDLHKNLTLVLDNIQDPGNLGTIIRTADWFGVRNIYCSNTTADAFNPKVIQATMGSFMRVKLHYTNLDDFFASLNNEIPVYGAFLKGENIFSVKAKLPAILIIGNESQGISKETEKAVNQKVSIHGSNSNGDSGGAESLNAAMAAGIIMSWLKKP